jgi:ribosomal protein S14
MTQGSSPYRAICGFLHCPLTPDALGPSYRLDILCASDGKINTQIRCTDGEWGLGRRALAVQKAVPSRSFDGPRKSFRVPLLLGPMKNRALCDIRRTDNGCNATRPCEYPRHDTQPASICWWPGGHHSVYQAHSMCRDCLRHTTISKYTLSIAASDQEADSAPR